METYSNNLYATTVTYNSNENDNNNHFQQIQSEVFLKMPSDITLLSNNSLSTDFLLKHNGYYVDIKTLCKENPVTCFIYWQPTIDFHRKQSTNSKINIIHSRYSKLYSFFELINTEYLECLLPKNCFKFVNNDFVLDLSKIKQEFNLVNDNKCSLLFANYDTNGY